MYFPIAVLYQAGKLAHSDVGLLGYLYSSKFSSYSIHDGDRNRLWPRETFTRDCYICMKYGCKVCGSKAFNAAWLK